MVVVTDSIGRVALNFPWESGLAASKSGDDDQRSCPPHSRYSPIARVMSLKIHQAGCGGKTVMLVYSAVSLAGDARSQSQSEEVSPAP